MRTAAYDLETYYDSECSVTTLGIDGYIDHPSFHVYLLSIVTDDGFEWVGDPKDAPWERFSGKGWRWVSHNASFDQRIHERHLIPKGVAPTWAKPEVWDCTSDLCAFSSKPRSLAGAADYLYNEKISKGIRDRMKGKVFRDMLPAKQEEVRVYALKDSRTCLRFWNDLSPKWPEDERRVSRISRAQAWRGLRLDRGALEGDVKLLKKLIWAAEQMIPWQGVTKTLSYESLCNECRKVGIDAPPSTDMKSDECAAWEDQYGEKYPWVDAMRTARRANALLKKAETMLSRIRPEDGRMGYENKYFGAHCMTGEAEVLTLNGWLPLNEWNGGDIAQWSSDSGSIRFLPALPNRFVIDEPMVEVDAPYVKGTFTKGHTIPCFKQVTFEFKTASAGDVANWFQSYVPISGKLMGRGSITPAQMRLLVAVQADGHWEDSQHGNGLQFVLRKLRKIDRVRKLFTDAGIPFRENVFPSAENGQVSIRVRGKDCPPWLTRDRKRFGAWLLDSSVDAREAFREEISLWDGWTPKRESRNKQYYTSGITNAEWVQTMIHLSNRAASICVRPPDGQRGESYICSIRDTRRALTLRAHWKELPRKLRAVFCPSTETGFWMCRSRGTIFVTGNTGRFGDGGESTGRYQSGGFNSRNLPRAEMFGEKFFTGEGKRFAHIWDPKKDKAVNLRHRIIPEDGCHFPICDLSAIEPRVLLKLAGDTDSLKLIHNGMHPYEVHARRSMGYDLDIAMKTAAKSDKAIAAKYQLAKARVLALGFQAGWVKFIMMAPTYINREECDKIFGAPVSKKAEDAFCKYLLKVKIAEWNQKWAQGSEEERRTFVNSWLIVSDFRFTNKPITGLWRKMHTLLEQSVGQDLEIELPSGRLLVYRKIARTDGNIEGTIIKNGKPTRVKLYGGKVVENMTQAVARDAFVASLLRLDDAGLWVSFHSHDEAVPEVPLSVTAEEVEKIMSTSPSWWRDLPLASECESSLHYKK